MSSGDDKDTCEFGHVFQVNGGSEFGDDIRSGKIGSLKDLRDRLEGDAADPYNLTPIMGEPYKTVKVSAGTQGTPYTFILVAADKFDDDLEWEIAKTEEKIFTTPQSNLHQEFAQRKQQAEQNVKQNMQGLEQLRKQEHMLQHDIRKLRTRIEDLKTGDEALIKGDFVQLVDGAGAGGQGADEQALRFLRDNDIYPTIVSDFNEIDSLDDLKPKDDGGTGKLANLPANEKAILKKKYTMYEKWKDLYGSEIQRKLNDLKKEMRRVERAKEETKNWLKPYVRDMVMINQKTQEELGDDLTKYMTFKGYATQFKDLEFIAYKPLEKHNGNLHEIEDEDDATHFKVIYIKGVHVNIAGGENPNSPAEGPTAGQVLWFPAVMCRHVFENIFEEKINRSKEVFDQLMEDYTGDFETDEGDEFQEARQDEGLSVGELRENIGEEIDDRPPLELSALIRRIEDGFDSPEKIGEQYGEEYLEAVNEILGTEYGEEPENGNDNGKKEEFSRAVKKFTGNYDDYYLDDPEGAVGDLKNEFKFSYYYDLKIGMGLYTMK